MNCRPGIFSRFTESELAVTASTRGERHDCADHLLAHIWSGSQHHDFVDAVAGHKQLNLVGEILARFLFQPAVALRK